MDWLPLSIVLLVFVCCGATDERTDNDGFYDDRKPEDTELRRLVSSLLERQERQETRLRQLERTVSGHVEDLRRKDVRIGHLERELHDLKQVSNPTIGYMTKHQSNVSTINANYSSPRVDPSKMKKARSSDSVVPVKSIRVPDESSTANSFSVYLSKNFVSHPNAAILFDKVRLDVAGNYNLGNGVYEVPVSGMYVFTWVITGELTEWLVTELAINGSPHGSIMTHTEAGHSWDTSTGVVVVPVSAGDHVFIRSTRGGTIRSISGDGISMFSGWQIA
ncbi:uncharacterized protein [Argopecten irradians]|uniref:uncharacterized protein n=1 Tax=Argopecten irradians TaxID=31199 RepID=UPI00371DED79